MQPSFLPSNQPPIQPQYSSPYPVIIQRLSPIYSNLTKKEIRGIQNTIDPTEMIICAGTMTNLSNSIGNKKRIIVVTNSNIYNIEPRKDGLSLFALCTPSSGFLIKRMIDVRKVYAITLSMAPASQYILHVAGEQDYRFCGQEKRNELITAIINAYFSSSQEPFPLYCTQESDLAKYQKSEADVKAKIDKRPQGDQVIVTPYMIAQGLDWILTNRKELIFTGPGNYTAQYMGGYFVPVGAHTSPSTHYNSYIPRGPGQLPSYYIPEVSQNIQQQPTETNLEVRNEYPGCTASEASWIKNRLCLMKLNTHIQLNTDFDKTYGPQEKK